MSDCVGRLVRGRNRPARQRVGETPPHKPGSGHREGCKGWYVVER